ncbi:hypothetical protein CYMTET_35071 [Cymbomonas tetramitiformis]|uniref:Uncharacterized protein n=1 Tax=Cymbomonas tetramitiformis TaxID=36881 RepID=A0AAE0FA09_9CHLO|nr:hypothetical protein CYMTET_35071 [Cymbomonas tetramitiformis]
MQRSTRGLLSVSRKVLCGTSGEAAAAFWPRPKISSVYSVRAKTTSCDNTSGSYSKSSFWSSTANLAMSASTGVAFWLLTSNTPAEMQTSEQSRFGFVSAPREHGAFESLNQATLQTLGKNLESESATTRRLALNLISNLTIYLEHHEDLLAAGIFQSLLQVVVTNSAAMKDKDEAVVVLGCVADLLKVRSRCSLGCAADLLKADEARAVAAGCPDFLRAVFEVVNSNEGVSSSGRASVDAPGSQTSDTAHRTEEHIPSMVMLTPATLPENIFRILAEICTDDKLHPLCIEMNAATFLTDSFSVRSSRYLPDMSS